MVIAEKGDVLSRMELRLRYRQGEMNMTTARKETEDAQDKPEQHRDKGGVTQEDRSKSLGSAQSESPFDAPERNPKREE